MTRISFSAFDLILTTILLTNDRIRRLLLTETGGRMPTVHLLDYVAGNVRSLVNAIQKLGYTIDWIKSPDDIARAEVSRKTIRSAQSMLKLPVAMEKLILGK